MFEKGSDKDRNDENKAKRVMFLEYAAVSDILGFSSD